MSKRERAKAALEHLRLAANDGKVSAGDVEALIDYFVESEKILRDAIDRLRNSRDAFRSKQVEGARKILEELL